MREAKFQNFQNFQNFQRPTVFPQTGVGGDVADLEGLGPQGCDTVLEGLGSQGCDERGGAGTLTCGNGPGGSFFTETALLDEVH